MESVKKIYNPKGQHQLIMSDISQRQKQVHLHVFILTSQQHGTYSKLDYVQKPVYKKYPFKRSKSPLFVNKLMLYMNTTILQLTLKLHLYIRHFKFSELDFS